MEAIVLFSTLLIGYLILRSRGGRGLSIKFDLGPTSTPKGKSNRLALGVALAVWSAGIIFVITHSQGSRASVALSLLGGVAVGLLFLAPRLDNRRK